MHFHVFLLIVFAAHLLSPVQPLNVYNLNGGRTPFSTSLETLQKKIGYTFKSIGLLRRAMTHASFSNENNRALSVLGADVIDTSVSLRSLEKDIDMSPQDLSRRKSEISKSEAACLTDGISLGLDNVIRVSAKTNSSTPTVICGGFRAIFGAIAVDTGKADEAGTLFWSVHQVVQAVAI